jgi:endonuclease/exonuclease/phosphatase family metal-dependent hydrolase
MGLFKKRRRSPKSSSLSEIPLLRVVGPGLGSAGVIGMILMFLTGQIDLSTVELLRGGGPSGVEARSAAVVQPIRLQELGKKAPETIRVATFNIQDFGKSKAADPQVMAILARVISQFDVVALQETHGGDADPVGALVQLLRSSGAQYAATISQPIGRTAQTESYAFLWDDARIRLVRDSAYLVHDPADRMHREPMVASFEAVVGAGDGRRPFRFTLINVHSSPSEVATSALENELNVLDDVYLRVRQYDYQSTGEEDFIMLGDLNVDTSGLGELGQIPKIESIAGNTPTNTRRSKTYDHILIDRTLTREYTGRFGVIDFQRDYGLNAEQALMVSDHQPLWAEFSAYELPRFDPVAASPNTIR